MPKSIPSLPGIEASSLPYSHVTEANGLVFVAGQVGNAPGERYAVKGGIEAETRQMFANLRRLLEAVGLGFDDIVKATVYLRNFDDFEAMNTIYREYFPSDMPTRATVGVSALARDFTIEIEVIAAR